MFFRVNLVLVCVLALVWAFGSTQERVTRTQNESGMVTATPDKNKKKMNEQKLVWSGKPSRAPQVPLTRHQAQVKRYVEYHFKDVPALKWVAFCESSWNQWGPDGQVYRGKKVADDVGVMQINLHYHGSRMATLGLDPHRIEDNVRYARILYKEQGLQPWSASAHCWGGKVVTASR